MKGDEAMREGGSKFHRLPLHVRDDTRESGREAVLGEKMIIFEVRFFELSYHTTSASTSQS